MDYLEKVLKIKQNIEANYKVVSWKINSNIALFLIEIDKDDFNSFRYKEQTEQHFWTASKPKKISIILKFEL